MSRIVDTAGRIPTEVLRPYVRSYQGSRMEGFSPGQHLSMPTAGLVVVVSLGGPLRIQTADSSGPADYSALATGLRFAPSTVLHDGSSNDISIDLTPIGARLMGVTAHSLAGQIVNLTDLWGATAEELIERVRTESSWEARFSVLDEIFIRARPALGGEPTADTLSQAWEQIVSSGGSVSISEVASDVGYSRRQLTHRFTTEFGVGPKQAARLVRFQRSLRTLRDRERQKRSSESSRTASIATVAHDCGYHDQSHMTREWRTLAGLAPTQWLAAEELPFVQDSAASGAVQ